MISCDHLMGCLVSKPAQEEPHENKAAVVHQQVGPHKATADVQSTPPVCNGKDVCQASFVSRPGAPVSHDLMELHLAQRCCCAVVVLLCWGVCRARLCRPRNQLQQQQATSSRSRAQMQSHHAPSWSCTRTCLCQRPLCLTMSSSASTSCAVTTSWTR